MELQNLEDYYNNLKKDTDEEYIFNILLKLLESLKNKNGKNDMFLSEADFQFCFAQAVKDINNKKMVILEYPWASKDLYEDRCNYKKWMQEKKCYSCQNREKPPKCNFENEKEKCENVEKAISQDKSKIDLFIKDNNEEYFIEFKYKLKQEKEAYTLCRYGKEFKSNGHGASNLGRYQVYEDIERLEQVAKHCEDANNFVIFLTNDENYVNYHKSTSAYNNFKLNKDSNGNVKLNNGELFYGKNKPEKIYNCKNPRTLFINKNYNGQWLKFEKKGFKSQFYILIINMKQVN